MDRPWAAMPLRVEVGGASRTSTNSSVDAEAVEEPREVKDPRSPTLSSRSERISFAIVHCDGGRGGLVVLTHHPRRAEKTKAILEKAFTDASLVLGLVTGVIKGGVEVDVDGLGRSPRGRTSTCAWGPILGHLVGQRLPFVVTQYAKRGRDVVLSRKAIIEDEARKRGSKRWRASRSARRSKELCAASCPSEHSSISGGSKAWCRCRR